MLVTRKGHSMRVHSSEVEVNCYRMSVKEDRGFFVVNFRHLLVHYLTRNDNMSNTTGATSGEDTAYPFGGLVFVPWSLARLMLLRKDV
jgi:hypothetical protein